MFEGSALALSTLYNLTMQNRDTIEKLINDCSEKNDAGELAFKLAAYGPEAIPYIIKAFNTVGAWVKFELIEALIYINRGSAKPFLKKVATDQDQAVFMRAIADDALERLKLESKEERLERKLRMLEQERDKAFLTDTIISIAVAADESIIPKLELLTARSRRVKDYVEVAKLVIDCGIDTAIDEHLSEKTLYNRNALAQAVYTSKPYERAVDVAIADLFSDDAMRLQNAASGIAMNLPAERRTSEVLNRLIDITIGDYGPLTRGSAVTSLDQLLTREDNEQIARLQEILDKRQYRSLWKPWKWFGQIGLKYDIENAIKNAKRRSKPYSGL